MWNYDKLFAEGNIVGLKNKQQDKIYPSSVDGRKYWGNEGYINWKEYFNDSLCLEAGRYSEYDFEIQYIIRLDEHGDVVEKLFDRERDIPKPMPELETGMFVRITDHGNMRNTILGYVDIQNCRVIYQDGTYSNLVPLYTKKSKVITDIVEVYSHKALCFNGCLSNEALIWRSPEYQSYLDSKYN